MGFVCFVVWVVFFFFRIMGMGFFVLFVFVFFLKEGGKAKKKRQRKKWCWREDRTAWRKLVILFLLPPLFFCFISIKSYKIGNLGKLSLST